MAPSCPGYPAERPSAQRPAGSRDFKSYETTESARVVLAAGTAFQEIIAFSGRPDSIIVSSDTAGIDVRFSNRGQAARAPIRIQQVGAIYFDNADEIVEARDAAGAGGQALSVTGRWGSRGIDVRANRPGPSRERPMLEPERLATQVPTSE